jgi:outer membrane lipoprotein-sorting protein
MNRHPALTVALAALALAAAAAAPFAAHASLADVAAHLKATHSLEAEFTQTGANGRVEHGHMTLARPGRVRFQYENAPILVVADGRALNLIDYKVSQVSSWPIRGTPLAVLLDDTLDLARFARVTHESAQEITVEAADPAHPQYGVTTLDFVRDSKAPAGWREAGWQVRDAQGNLTRVTLSQIRYNIDVNAALFRFRDPRQPRIPGKG